jgi:pimeloyl-ACP methyl ester carboxylesterase
MHKPPPDRTQALTDLFTDFTAGKLSRRDFMAKATALGVAAAAAASLDLLLASPGEARAADAQKAAQSASKGLPLEIAEWSYFWVNVKRAELARGSVVGGQQMYVEYQIPKVVKHPYPIVLVHGGGGQGTDWMGTPDGRPGWFQYLLQQGYVVYVVDRPGHGRSPYHPDLHGDFGPNTTLEFLVGSFTPPNDHSPMPTHYQRGHTQWPGSGDFGSRDLHQFAASQGGAYVQPVGFGAAPPPGSAPAGIVALMARMFSADQPANALPPSPIETATAIAHMAWREAGTELLDKIGPAVFITHSAGGPFGWLVAESRPQLVKAIVCVEPAVVPFVAGCRWGISTIPVTYDPPLSDPAELNTVKVNPPEDGFAYYLQADRPRQLPNLKNIPTVVVTAEASFLAPGNPGVVAFLRQAGCPAEEMRLGKLGIHGNGHMMMVEKNNRAVLQPILDWLDKHIPHAGGGPVQHANLTAMSLANQGFFWVGCEEKKVTYGTIIAGQMYVQYFIPKVIEHPYPVILVHGGTGQMLHYMGSGNGAAGWAQYYVQAGYQVYLIDRPGHGRAPYHPDALGPIGPQPTYELLLGDIKRAATGPHKQWPGPGNIGDPLVDQFVASQNATSRDLSAQHSLWASRGAELLDRIGPAIIQTHSAGGSFGWLAADQRPALVKAIVVFEGAFSPFAPNVPWGMTAAPLAYDPPISSAAELNLREVPATAEVPVHRLQTDPPHKLKNLQAVPTLYFAADNSGRREGPAIVEFLRQAGSPAEYLNLRDQGILGNGHFAMIETNRKQVFEVITHWLDAKIKKA